MNQEYLDAMPAVENKYFVELGEGEKVIFTAEMSNFGTEHSESLRTAANPPYFTMTNKQIFIDNGMGIWTINLAEEVASAEKKISKFLWMKTTYFRIMLKKPSVYYMNKKKKYQNGFEFYFKDEDIESFDKIISKAFSA